MKKMLAFFCLMLLTATLVVAQESTEADPIPKRIIKPTLKVLGFIGKGIAISTSNPMDFKIAKGGIGIFAVKHGAIETDYRVGILFLDDEKYKLRDVVIEDGKTSGKVFNVNNTEVGSFNLESVEKENVEVWAGTIEISGETRYLYLVAVPRSIKPLELKAKIVRYCKNHPEDQRCSEEVADFCQKNPTNEKCKEIFKKYCAEHMYDARCRHFMASYCKIHPEIEDCRLFTVNRARRFCEKHPESAVCVKIKLELVKFCMKNPNHKRCREYCAEHPEKCQQVIKSIAEFCTKYPKHVRCLEYCKKYPKACINITKDLVDFCVKNPTHLNCVEYCKNHPVACKIVSKELAKFCIGNAEDPRCVSYCKNHPLACRKVTIDMGSYCAEHRDTPTCQIFCKKFPKKCEVNKPEVIEIETEEVEISKITKNLTGGENASNMGRGL